MFNKDGGLALQKTKNNAPKKYLGHYKVLIVDDEQSIHDVTALALEDIVFNNKTLKLYHAYSAKEAEKVLESEPNIAVIFLDVVMETDSAGLDLVKVIRTELNNSTVRIILRTGQPGQAPEENIIVDYDINDYKNKAELTTQKLFTTLISSLRSYTQLIRIKKAQAGLEKVITATSSIVQIRSIHSFMSGLLEQVLSFVETDNSINGNETSAYIGFYRDKKVLYTAGTGKYTNHDTRYGLVHDKFDKEIEKIFNTQKLLLADDHILWFEQNNDDTGLLLILEGNIQNINIESSLLNIFMRDATITSDNILLTEDAKNNEKETIFLLSELAEQRSKETGKHVRRVAYYAKEIAEELNFSTNDVEKIFAGAPMHDVGKIAIRDGVLKKPEKLTEEEFEEMKLHSVKGYELLKDSTKGLMSKAATIAHEHHENWDGTGYPRGLKGTEIDSFAMIVSLCDVFDALSNARVYKEAWGLEKVFEHIENERGKKFDPAVVDAFFARKKNVLQIFAEQKD